MNLEKMLERCPSTARKQELQYYAEHFKKLIEDTNPKVPIIVYYLPGEEKTVKKIYGEILGKDCCRLTFEECPLSESENIIRIIRFGSHFYDFDNSENL